MRGAWGVLGGKTPRGSLGGDVASSRPSITSEGLGATVHLWTAGQTGANTPTGRVSAQCLHLLGAQVF